jgi:hypothetical protein
VTSDIDTQKYKFVTNMAAARAKKHKKMGLVSRVKPSKNIRKPKAVVWAHKVQESANIVSGAESSKQEKTIQFNLTELLMMQSSTYCSRAIEV